MDNLDQYLTVLEWIMWFVLLTVGGFMFGYGYYALLGQGGKHYKRKGQDFPLWLKAAAWVFIIFFDTPYNIVFVSIWFREWPRQWTVTARMKMWRRKYRGLNYNNLTTMQRRRVRFADWLCDDMLDYHDINGDHC